jgi:hypothetical protein
LTPSEVPSPATETEWVVLLEAACPPDAAVLDKATAQEVVRALDDRSTRVLHHRERLAVQQHVMERDMERAFGLVLRRWQKAVQPLIPDGWFLVRGEIVTREEFDAEQ